MRILCKVFSSGDSLCDEKATEKVVQLGDPRLTNPSFQVRALNFCFIIHAILDQKMQKKIVRSEQNF